MSLWGGAVAVQPTPCNMDPGRYVFNHIPKSGGTSLLAVCRENLEDWEISPHLHEHHIRLVRPERYETYRLICGHFSLCTQAGFSRSRYSMTLLREPVRTILSTYNFWRSASNDDPVTVQAKHLSFDEFVARFENSPAIVNNPYTHHFAAIGHDYPGTPEDLELLLKVAKANLAAFNFVGICEQFERSVQLLCRELNWRIPAVLPHENRSRPAQILEQISPETMKHLRARTELDSELYTYAKGFFAERFLRMQQHTSCSQENYGKPAAEPTGECQGHVNRVVSFPLPYPVQREAEIRKVTAEYHQGEQHGTMRITVDYERPCVSCMASARKRLGACACTALRASNRQLDKQMICKRAITRRWANFRIGSPLPQTCRRPSNR